MVIAASSRSKANSGLPEKDKETNSGSELLYSPQCDSPCLSLDFKALVL